jgi:hypothetical protein
MISRQGRAHDDWNLPVNLKTSVSVGLNHGLRAPEIGMGRRPNGLEMK